MESTTLAARAAEQAASRPRRQRDLRRLLRRAAIAAYLVALGLVCAFRGLPTSRDALFLWILLGTLAASAAETRRWFRRVVIDWFPFAVILFAYDVLRGYADTFFSPHVRPQLRADALVFGGTVPTVWLQEHLWQGASGIDWLDYVTWTVYLTHFFGTLVVAGCLWVAASRLFRRYVATVAVLSLAGFATYALFPAAPPWLASREGLLPHGERITGYVSEAAPVSFFGSIWEHGSRYANDVAAVPSLHAAYALLIALFLWPHVGRGWRVLLAAYPLAMAFSLVYLGEHYVSDVLLGWLYAAAALVAVRLAADRLGAARSRRAPHTLPA
jgi:membrane-associated phospholipid phosphatase